MAGNLYCYKNGGPLDWKEYIEIISMAALTGWAVDFALNGFSLAVKKIPRGCGVFLLFYSRRMSSVLPSFIVVSSLSNLNV